MKIDLVFLVILGFMVLRTICNKTVVNNEHMGDPAPTPTLDPKITTAINDAIKTLYSADVSAIQNLSLIANKLQTGGYTCPGDYTVTGKMTVGGALKVVGDTNITGNLIASDCLVSGICGLKDVNMRLVAEEVKTIGILARLDALEAKCKYMSTSNNKTVITGDFEVYLGDIFIGLWKHYWFGDQCGFTARGGLHDNFPVVEKNGKLHDVAIGGCANC